MREIIMLAVSQLRDDRFRTLLSLLGVTVGIFAIVAVFTLVDSLQEAINEGFEKYGTDVLFVEKTPLEPDLNENGVFRWWEYAGRPDVTWREYCFLSENMPSDVHLAYKCGTSDGVIGVSDGWDLIVQEGIAMGRCMSEDEMKGGYAVMIGEKVREKQFGDDANPVGGRVRLYGKEFTVVGVFESSGSNLVSTVDTDNSYIVPYRTLEHLVDLSSCERSITVEGADEEMLRMMMRQCRRLTPGENDDFAINRLSFVLEEMTEMFSIVDTLGWVIGIFSLLVGAFGIMNIMFVSVQERTPEIGIQKALGAMNSVITFEYLTESAVLSMMGGLLGVALVWLVTMFVPEGMITVRLTMQNLLTGLAISFVIGVVAGVAPARRAAGLNPVDAINAV